MIYREMLKSKVHRATVTQADLHYVGSITVDSDLMDAADIRPGEKADVVDINNGSRLSTCAIEGPAGGGIIAINGAAARLVSPGDLTSSSPTPRWRRSTRAYRPRIVFVDERNQPVMLGTDRPKSLRAAVSCAGTPCPREPPCSDSRFPRQARRPQ